LSSDYHQRSEYQPGTSAKELTDQEFFSKKSIYYYGLRQHVNAFKRPADSIFIDFTNIVLIEQ
jgi:hypothetical protein